MGGAGIESYFSQKVPTRMHKTAKENLDVDVRSKLKESLCLMTIVC